MKLFAITTNKNYTIHTSAKKPFKDNAGLKSSLTKKKSLKEILIIEEAIWLFLRFATNIPIPRAKVLIPYSMPGKHFSYHFRYGHHPIIEDYANDLACSEMPIKLKDIVNSTDIFSKWDTFLHEHYHAVKTFSKEMQKASLLDERISNYVRIVDSLTNNTKKTHLRDRIQQCFEKYARTLPFEIEEDTSNNLKRIRVAFSHLGDKDFIPIEIPSRKYLQYEKLVVELIQIIIKDNLGIPIE